MQKIMFNDKYGLTEAVLAKRKTQTRRAVNDWEMMKLLRKFDSQGSLLTLYERFNFNPKLCELFILNRRVMHYRRNEIIAIAQPYKDVYFHPSIKRPRPDMETEKGWSNKMFVRAEDMPHHIRITKISIERLQDISEDDCLKEGIKEIYENGVDDSSEFYGYAYLPDATPCVDETYNYPQEAYASLINRISGKGTWESDPYVFVYDFERID
jgi:hypothetical protein